MAEELPPLWALDKAAVMAGCHDWDHAKLITVPETHLRLSIIAHARTLAKYEQPPVDPDEEALVRILQEWSGKMWPITDHGYFPATLAQFKLELNRRNA